MYLGNPVATLAAALYSAVYKDMPDEKRMRHKPGYYDMVREKGAEAAKALTEEYTTRPDESELEVISMFAQTWGSTALGFGGIGGAAMTPAYTTIIANGAGAHCVYFGGGFAYRIDDPNAQFFKDMQDHDMHEVRGARSRYSRICDKAATLAATAVEDGPPTTPPPAKKKRQEGKPATGYGP